MGASSVLSDDDYDVVSNPSQRSLESSLNDFGHIPVQTVHEPPPSQAARDTYRTASWTAEDIQEYVRRALHVSPPPGRTSVIDRTKRVYVDGAFDGFSASHALQLRQAKLSFPSVYLVVGIFPDDALRLHGFDTSVSHVERCEVVRHCRWVDEIITDAPWVLDSKFLDENGIDYIALDEGTSVDPAIDKLRLSGYDNIKEIGKVIPTRRTLNPTFPVHIHSTTPVPPLTPEPRVDFLE
ncbi:Choline-phosphate cytidylyltransferase B [Hypsizygus marmoreus]|uniref:choline-phosphate cytidylyltransferase n=1 Tax=Hypsizygus marmoreus TaxID=39966 RepID=A0A369JQY2_HYPMA|nr:Choline-phosphate cytidylyltransferase B [Hypsizygus marmoreus]